MRTIYRNMFFMVMVWLLAACGGGGGGGGNSATAPTVTGFASVAATSKLIPAGDPACPNGGVAIETGVDKNQNGILEVTEVTATENVCNGASGTNGATGATGATGLNALVNMTPEPVGLNCLYGGVKIDIGVGATVNTTKFICNGAGTDRSWGAPDSLYLGTDPINAENPDIGVDASGRMVGVWIDNFNIVASRYIPGIGWGTATLIENEATPAPNDYPPKVAVDKNGNAIAVFRINNAFTGISELWANRLDIKNVATNGGWGSAQRISGTLVYARNNNVAVDDNGNALAVWVENDNKVHAAFYNNSNFNMSLGIWYTDKVIDISSNNKGPVYNIPRVVTDKAGKFIVVWEQMDSGIVNAYSAMYDSGKIAWPAWTPIDKQVAANIKPDTPLGSAMNTSDNAYVSYIKEDTLTFNANNAIVPSIYVARYISATDSWSTTSTATIGNATTDYNKGLAVFNSQIVTDAAGNAFVVWTQLENNGIVSLYSSNFKVSTASWSAPQLVEIGRMDVRSSNLDTFKITMDGKSNVFAVWQQDSSVRAARYVALTGKWEAAQLLDAENTSSDMAIAADTDGNATAIWEKYQMQPGITTFLWEIFSKRFQ